MPNNVKWWTMDMQKAASQGTSRRWYETNMQDILLKWDDNQDVKFIKVSAGARNRSYVELMLFNSEFYYKRQAKWRRGTPIIYDRYQLVEASVRIKHSGGRLHEAQTAEAAPKLLAMMNKLAKKSPMPDGWLALDEVNELILEIDELMENLEEYEVLDQLGF